MTQTTQSPALIASQSSWRCVQAHDREGWLALMADDVVIEDPIGKSVTNPDGSGIKGKEAVGAFFDTHIAANSVDGHLRGDVPVQLTGRDRPHSGVAQRV
ncbi:steroid delta-isomerase [Mycobacterium tuberculosis MAL010105]|nr:steroid delta-isomerase [Mycobacterium tuberculosis MAL010105]KEB88264.1 steroid delta-isomerase [Mycobacterium tuberculosis MAL010117]